MMEGSGLSIWTKLEWSFVCANTSFDSKVTKSRKEPLRMALPDPEKPFFLKRSGVAISVGLEPATCRLEGGYA